jgi:hypothetical protein
MRLRAEVALIGANPFAHLSIVRLVQLGLASGTASAPYCVVVFVAAVCFAAAVCVVGAAAEAGDN